MSKIAYLSETMHERLLGRPKVEIPRSKLREAAAKWERYGVQDLQDKLQPIDIFIPEEIPPATECIALAYEELRVDRVISRLEAFSRGAIPEIPSEIPTVAGWWINEGAGWKSGSYPTAVTAVFDFETVIIDGQPYPVCCSAVSAQRWYVWVWDETDPQPFVDWGKNSLLIGHQASYDRSFLANEYNYQTTGSLFPCTMSMWLATHAFGAQQGGLVRSKREELDFVPDWLDETGNAGLADVYKFFTGKELDKGVVKELVKGGLEWLQREGNLEQLLAYNLHDVKATFEIFQFLWPEYRAAYHNPRLPKIGDLMIYADLLQGKSWLPVSAERFPTWYTENENRYQLIVTKIKSDLMDVAKQIVQGRLTEYLCSECPSCPIDATTYEKQLISLDWVAQRKDEEKFVRGWQPRSTVVEAYRVEVKPIDKERMKELRKKVKGLDPRFKKYLDRSSRLHTTYFIKESLEPGIPMEIPCRLKRILPDWFAEKIKSKTGLTIDSRITPILLGCQWLGKPLEWFGAWYAGGEALPHPDDRSKLLTELFIKGMRQPIDSGALTSRGETKAIMEELSKTLIWNSFRKRFQTMRTRITSEGNNTYPVWITQDTRYPGTISFRMSGFSQVMPNKKDEDAQGKPCYSSKLGVSIKSLIEAPPGYNFVGADLNSQELGIFAMVGDALAGFHGSQPGSLMTILGSKKDKTTMHWVLAQKANIDYTLAKNCIYGSIYGLAVKGLKDYFQKSNVLLLDDAAKRLAEETLELLKGENNYGTFAHGLLSDSFNAIKKKAQKPVMETVICGRKISKALRNLGKDYMTTRVNWMVQSAGSDQRCLMVVWMHWLLKKYGIDARLITPIHDEFRYCVAEDQVEDFNWAFQLCHLLMQAFTVDQLGLDGITCNHAYFQEVDLDRYLRKSVDDPVETLCNPVPLPLGKVLRPVVLKDYIPSFARS